jgi:flagellin-like protein
MNFSHRKAISPIIATVLIIAVTLIAAVAIGGFVFGIFGSSSNSAQVSVTAQAIKAADYGAAGTTAFTWGAAAGDFITLTNTGTAATTVTGITITWAGAVNSFTPTASYTIGAAGSATAVDSILLPNPYKLTVAAASGQTYTGTVTLGNGAVLIFTGAFQ